MIALLLTLGTVAQGWAGAQFALEGVEEGLGVPLASGFRHLTRAAAKDVRDIAHGFMRGGKLLVDGTIGELAELAPPERKPAEIQVPTVEGPTLQDQIARTYAAIEAKLTEADAKAAALEAQAANEADDTKASALEAQAMTIRNYSSFAEELCARAQEHAAAGADAQLIADACQWALSCANAALNPPTNAASALASGMSSDVKAVVTRVIDAMSRAQAPDFHALADHLLPSATPAEDVAPDAPGPSDLQVPQVEDAWMGDYYHAGSTRPIVQPIAGHEGHKHGDDCKCEGQCDACAWSTLEGAAKTTTDRRRQHRHGHAKKKSSATSVAGGPVAGFDTFAGGWDHTSIPNAVEVHAGDDMIPRFGTHAVRAT